MSTNDKDNPTGDKDELVVRLGDFDSKRTFGIRSNKASIHLKRSLIDCLNSNHSKINKVKLL